MELLAAFLLLGICALSLILSKEMRKEKHTTVHMHAKACARTHYEDRNRKCDHRRHTRPRRVRRPLPVKA